MRVITAKFNSTCADTGRPIKKGDTCVYDPIRKKVYASGSPTQQKHYQAENAKRDQGGDMLDAQIQKVRYNDQSILTVVLQPHPRGHQITGGLIFKPFTNS